MKKRIWELDALRGLCIIGIVVVHLLYDLESLLGVIRLPQGGFYDFLKDWGGLLFFLLSGICATLGSRPVKRGLAVLTCGLIVSAVTAGMYLLGLSGRSMVIYFGVLHCLGLCMLLWPLFRRLPRWALALSAAVILALGFYLQSRRFDTGLYLVWLGLRPYGFATSDYFPVLPFLGFFLAGALLGRTLYARKESLLPQVDTGHFLIRFLVLCGKWSLPIYMLHQPVLMGIVYLFTIFP